MKRVVCIAVIILLLMAMAPAALAAGSASMSGPGTVRSGDTIQVSFYAGGGILGGSGSVSYDSSQLTLQGYTQVIGGSWVVEFSGNHFVFYDNSMAIFLCFVQNKSSKSQTCPPIIVDQSISLKLESISKFVKISSS